MTPPTPSPTPTIAVLIEHAIRRRIPRGWDENHITFSWLEEIFEHYGNKEMPWAGGNILLDCKKLTGRLEQTFGDVGFLVKLSSFEGKSFVGFASMEAKRSFPDKLSKKYVQLDSAQLEFQAASSACHRLLLYSHTAISVGPENITHAVVLPAQVAVLCDDDASVLEKSGMRLSTQVSRYLRGWDLDFSPRTVEAVLSGEHRFGHLLRAHVGLTPGVRLDLSDLQVPEADYVNIDTPDQDMDFDGPSQPPPPLPLPPTPIRRPGDHDIGGYSR